MYLPGTHPELVDLLIEQFNTTIELLVKHLPPNHSSVDLLPTTAYHNIVGAGQVGVVMKGFLQACWGEKTVFILQPGDLILQSRSQSGICLLAEDPVTVHIWENRAFYAHIATHPEALNLWQKAILLQNSVFAHAYAAATKKGLRPTAGFTRYIEGDIILHQGDLADNVYTMLKGSAKVLVNKTEVGEIHEGEIFGAIACLTAGRRSATVMATSSCTVMAVPKEEFVELLHAQPETCLKLIETMANQIISMNARLSNSEQDFY
ncbi:MAG: cyclic nucleotide-binding domain-containing protein [Pseudomonadales bacterium]|nr:cyclic nucleotide-binding domain-containing protein [Pseudomonadales bacterium]